jgi:sulfite exporter TauE/SafE
MALFGLGTLPVMATLVLVKNKVSLSLRRSLGKLVPYAMVLIGTLFILRGMNLGIPYISPVMHNNHEMSQCSKLDDHKVIECH